MSEMSIHEVLQYLPHRFPFLLVDRVVELIPGKSITALKNVTINEAFFTGHFPQRPVMPGVLIIEALGQASCILAFKTVGGTPQPNSLNYLAGIDNARFKQVVEPGDQLYLNVEIIRARRDLLKVRGTATVDGKVVCSAELMSVRKGHSE